MQNTMIFKLYITKYEGDERPDPKRFNGFRQYYEDNGVTVVGGWSNKDDPSEAYFMTGYTDENHYNSFVEKMKNDPEYQKLTESLQAVRNSVEVKTLTQDI